MGLPHCDESNCSPEHPCTRTVHAEAGAIAFAAKIGISTEGTTLYTTFSPCLDCAKLIINAGIIEVVYLKKYRKTEGIDLLHQTGIKVREYHAD